MAKAKRLTGIDPLAYVGVEPNTPLQFTIQQRAPTVNDYNNWNVGSLWLDEPTQDVWMLVDKDARVATWIMFTGDLQTLTGDSGGAVSPDGNNTINIVSSSGGGFSALSFDGDPGTNTIVLNTDGTIPVQFDTDSGSSVASGGVLNVVGASGISVSGAGDTITVDTDGTLSSSFPTDSGTATPAAGVLSILGGLNMNTAGSGSTVTVNMDNLGGPGVVFTDSDGVMTSVNGTDGQVIIGSTAGSPSWANITSTGGTITITEGSNSINIDTSAGSTTSGFSAYKSSQSSNVTGDGTQYFFVCDTELFDEGSDYDNTTGIYTAPSDGKYMFGAGVQLSGMASQKYTVLLALIDSNNVDYRFARTEGENEAGETVYNGSIFIELSSGETVKPYVTVSGGSKIIEVDGAADPIETYFWGYRVPL